MSAIKRIRVTISDSKLIPTIGKGPIHSPISITEDQYNMLVNLGYKVIKAGDVRVAKIESAKPVEEPVVEQPVVEVTEDETEVAQEEEIVVVEEEPVVEVVEEEEVTEEVEESEEVTSYTMEDLAEATKKELKAILDEREASYGYNDTLKELKEAVVASNPA
jgi:exosome complex component RRP41